MHADEFRRNDNWRTMMTFKLRNLVAALAIGAATITSAHAYTWSSTAKFGTYTQGAYSWNNDVWGKHSGPQTIWVNSVSDWGVTSDQPNFSGVKSYPHISYTVGKPIDSLTTLTSSVTATLPSGGAWESTYDIWDVNNQYEIMLWLNYTGTPDGCGNVKPISYNWTSAGCAIPVTTVTVGGYTWNVFRGTNGSNQTFSFLLTQKSNSTNIDILAILKWLENNGWMGNVTMGEVQYGFEITSSKGGMNFQSGNFNVTAQ
jgi:hypothetical protein